MVRKYSFKFRKRNPGMFPYLCEICKHERRFKETSHKTQHDEMKHGVYESALRGHDHRVPIAHSSLAYPSNYSLSSMSASELQKFVQDQIEPDTAYNTRCKAVVNSLYEYMQTEFPDDLRPSEVFKGGSLGKGTAVKGKSDADLVVYLVNFHSIPELERSMPSILKRMKRYLGRKDDCTVKGKTRFSVQVSLSCDSIHTQEVDILPSVYILSKDKKEDIYSTMKSESSRTKKYYSAALAPLQTSFVSSVPTKVKTLIRLIKYWRKTFFEESTSGSVELPTSYPLELITIGEWKDAGSPENFDLRKGFFHVLRAIENYRKLKRAWNTNYDNFKCNDPYYVMDPANPFNNVMKRCNCWKMVAKTTKQFLNESLFRGLSSCDGWV